jgi:hypothetical protein
MMRSSFLILTFGLAACSETDTEDIENASATWYRDAKPVLDQHCVRCHDGSGLGPGNFRDPATAEAYAPAMIARIDAGEMPPPAADPDCHSYENSARLFLDPAARDTLQDWIDSDYALGDPATEPEGPPAIPELAHRDLTLRTAAAYAPQFVDRNEYRCFILDLDTTQAVWITGFEPIIDQASISHHTVLFIDPYGAADQYVEDDATQSWKCPDVVPDETWSMLHAWAPGNNPVEFPPGSAMPINAGSKIVLQMHYFDGGTAVADEPGYYFSTTDQVPDFDKIMYFIGLGPQEFTIPAGDASYPVGETVPLDYLIGVPATTTVYGVFPHMHVLGKSYSFTSTGDAGDQCIAEADSYDFANQPTYWFEEPIVLPPGTEVQVECTYDNSAGNPDQLNNPPVDVSYGENTDQEMCFALLYATLSF